MKGLIIKDLINLKAQAKILLLIVAIWFVVAVFNKDAVYFSYIMIVFAVMLPITTMSYDEKYKWNSFALTMPVLKSDIVNAKYVFMILSIAALTLISAVGNLIMSGDIFQSVSIIFYIFPAGLIINAITLPPIFHFGVETGRIVLIVIMVLIALLIVGTVNSSLFTEFMYKFNKTVWICILWIAGILLSAASLALSKAICERKDF